MHAAFRPLALDNGILMTAMKTHAVVEVLRISCDRQRAFNRADELLIIDGGTVVELRSILALKHY